MFSGKKALTSMVDVVLLLFIVLCDIFIHTRMQLASLWCRLCCGESWHLVINTNGDFYNKVPQLYTTQSAPLD